MNNSVSNPVPRRGVKWWAAAAAFALHNPREAFDLVRAGAAEPEYREMVAVGADRYLAAIAAGDVAADADRARRAEVCAGCPKRVLAMSPGGKSGWVYEWCGVPLNPLAAGQRGDEAVAVLSINGKKLGGDWDVVDWTGVVGPSCGCLLPLKRTVASERCPAGLWGAVTPGTG